ncbi:MAG: cytochrome c [Candidatus Thiodiazotropha sp. (ex Semelilucina semeliformis)]|nr:cytochrome c [Candidatus Thiodiazotropha sp. (ex Semelilucina semeliformis)]
MNSIINILFALCIGSVLFFASQSTMADALAGKAIYDGIGACGSCHGPSGQGDGPAAMAMNPKPRSFGEGAFIYDTDGDGKKGTDADLVNIIKNGSAKYGGAPTMPARADIPESDIQALVAYIRTLKQ